MAQSRLNLILLMLLAVACEAARMATSWPIVNGTDHDVKSKGVVTKKTKTLDMLEAEQAWMDANRHCHWSKDERTCKGEGCVLRPLPFESSSRTCRLSDKYILQNSGIAKKFLELESHVLESDSIEISSKCDKIVAGSLVSVMRGRDCARRFARSFQTINFMMRAEVEFATDPAVTELNSLVKSYSEKALRNLIRVLGDEGSAAVLEAQRKVVQNPQIISQDFEAGMGKVIALLSDIVGDDDGRQEATKKIKAMSDLKANRVTSDIRERFDKIIDHHNLITDEKSMDKQLTSELEHIENEREVSSNQSSLLEYGNPDDLSIIDELSPRSGIGRVVIRADKIETTVPAFYTCKCYRTTKGTACRTCGSKPMWNGRFKPELVDSVDFNLQLNHDWLTTGLLQRCLDKLSDIGSNVDGIPPILTVFKNSYKKQAWKRVVGILTGALVGVTLMAVRIELGPALPATSLPAGEALLATSLPTGLMGWIGAELRIDNYKRKKFSEYEDKWGAIMTSRNQRISNAVAEFSEEIGFVLRYEGSHFVLLDRKV